MKQTYLLRNEAIRNNAIDAILSLPIDDKSPHEVHVKEPKRTKAQNDRITDVLFDPDFCDFNLWVTRRAQTVDEDGIGSDSEVKTQFAGVVTVDRSLENRRMQAGQVISGAILIVTTERLTQGQTGRDADIVTYQNRDYRVTFVDPYTAYGAGFVQAHCELLPFDGGTPVEQ